VSNSAQPTQNKTNPTKSMSNIKDMLEQASHITAFSVVSSTEYSSTTPFLQLETFSSPEEIMEVILECSRKKEMHTHKCVYKTTTAGTSSWQSYMRDEDVMEAFAIILMQKIIPAYAKSKLFVPYRNDKPSDADVAKYTAHKTTELIEAFNRGLHAYNVSQLKTIEELHSDEKQSEETESK
jgi:hypothetical protein